MDLATQKIFLTIPLSRPQRDFFGQIFPMYLENGRTFYCTFSMKLSHLNDQNLVQDRYQGYLYSVYKIWAL